MDIQEQLKAMKEQLGNLEKELKQTDNSESDEADLLAEKFAEKVAVAVATAMKETQVSEKAENKAMKNTKELDFNGKALGDLSKEEKITKFFQSVVSNDKVRAKALSEGTDSQGGYLVPDEFRAEIIAWQRDNPVLRNYVSVFPMAHQLLELPKLAADVAIYWGSENTSISTSSIDFGNLQLTAKKLNALMYMSTELFEDSAVDITSFITDRFAQAVSDEEDKKITNGSGSGEPTGILQATVGGTIAGGNAQNVDQLISTYWRLPSTHRRNAYWIMASKTLETLDGKKDDNGQYLLNSPRTDGEQKTFKGRPVLEYDGVGSSIVFGDLRFYYLGDRRRLSVKTTTEGAGTFEKDQVAIKITERIDGNVALSRAFRKVTSWY